MLRTHSVKVQRLVEGDGEVRLLEMGVLHLAQDTPPQEHRGAIQVDIQALLVLPLQLRAAEVESLAHIQYSKAKI